MAVKISFVVPAYNEEKFVGECLEHILGATRGKPYETEIVVVNNASTDRTKEVAAGYPGVRVVDEQKKGLTRARERGYRETTGEFVANIDSDVRIPEDWPDKALAEFSRSPRLVCLSGPFVYFDLSPAARFSTKLFYAGGFIFYKVARLLTGRGGMVQGGNFILRRAALEAIGGFDTTIEFFGEDTDIARRASAVGRVEFSFNLWVWSSGRRLASHGIIRTGITYAANFFWVTLLGRPLHQHYTDIRPAEAARVKK